MTKHLNSNISSYTPHICDICGKKFLQIGSYRRHLRTHDEGFKEATRINLEGRSGATDMYILQDDVEDGPFEDEDDGSNIMSPEVSIREYDGENMILNTMEGETLMIGEPDGQGNVTVIGSACSMEEIQNLGHDGKEYYLIEVKDCISENGEVEAKVFEWCVLLSLCTEARLYYKFIFCSCWINDSNSVNLVLFSGDK